MLEIYICKIYYIICTHIFYGLKLHQNEKYNFLNMLVIVCNCKLNDGKSVNFKSSMFTRITYYIYIFISFWEDCRTKILLDS